MTIVRFNPKLRATVVGDDQVFLVGEREQFLLRGRLYARLAPLLDGQRTTAEIVEALDGVVSAAEVHYALGLLEKRGYLGAEAEGLDAAAAGFWQLQGAGAANAVERLGATPVAVRALGGLDDAPLRTALAEAGVAVSDEAAVQIVLADDYLDPELDVINRRALATGARWLLVKPGGITPWIGPFFRPGAGACWACLAHRVRGNRPVEAFLEARTSAPIPTLQPRVGLALSRRAAVDLAALAVAEWIADGGRGALDDALVTLDLARFETTRHAVTPRPQCPVCGDPELLQKRAEAPVVLESRPKLFTDDGGHRCTTPEETLAKYQHLISPITGVISNLHPHEERNQPLRPVYMAVYRSVPQSDKPSLDDFRQTSSGKGRTVAQARAGALSEGVERHSSIFLGDEPRRRARIDELDGAVAPNDLQTFSEAQFQAREALNAKSGSSLKKVIPIPFDARVSLDWTPVWSLTHARRRYVPTSYCWSGVPAPVNERFCSYNPNGSAAGNCVEEAILQGFFELVERDAVALWWYNRIERPAVDLDSFEQPYFRALDAEYQAMGHRIWVLDITTDLEIPAFVAVAEPHDGGVFQFGFGAHAEARLGVQRALTELNQCFVRDAVDNGIKAEPYLMPDRRAPRRTRADFPYTRNDDLRDDVLDCVERAARVGLETLVLDQTRPDVGLSVVKVIVPGMRHFWPRLGPGRLYDVPVRRGWLERPRAEAELNPAPVPV